MKNPYPFRVGEYSHRYDEVNEIKNLHHKIKIICKKHGVFVQKPANHLKGDGCPKCSRVFLKNGYVCDSKTEAFVLLDFLEKKVEFIHNSKYPNCPRNFRYDFYIPKENKYIEVTSFDENIDRKKKNFYTEYVSRIKWKRNFVEKVLHANFGFLYLTMTKDMISFVSKNMV